MTTTVSMARPTPGAGPTHQEQPMDYRALERILIAANNGHIHLTPGLDYIDRRTGRDVNDLVYAAEDKGWLALLPGGRMRVTDAGVQWLGRERKRARKPDPDGPKPPVPVFSDSGKAA
ncbi:hypothetical protein [Micromonospora sp. NPDC049891]|uniref:hypothetical protein n=1 Tax=Micromonospora sp. NPDC049891 TaxID=3155655 RepID=UPI0033CE28AC